MHRSFRFITLQVILQAVLILPVALADTVQSPPINISPGIHIKTGEIVLKVDDFEAARDQVINLARNHGAELDNAKTRINFQGKKNGSLDFKMSSDQLDPLMNEIRKTGRLYSERADTRDESSDYQSLERRTGLMKQNEEELLTFLHRPVKMRGSDILYIQSRLFSSRVEASDVIQRRLDLEENAQHAALRVMLFEPEPRKALDVGDWRAHGSYKAKLAFMTDARKLVTGLYFLLWFAPFWVPALLVLVLVVLKAYRIYNKWRLQQAHMAHPQMNQP